MSNVLGVFDFVGVFNLHHECVLSPAMAKPLGDIKMLGVCPCVRASVRPSVTKLVSAITSDCMHPPIYTIFDTEMHPTIALDEFVDE